MTQNADLFNEVHKKIESIKKRLESYEKVEAPISKYTLLDTLDNLQKVDETLENGFVEDSCNDIDSKLWKI